MNSDAPSQSPGRSQTIRQASAAQRRPCDAGTAGAASARPEELAAELDEAGRGKCRPVEPAEAALAAALDEAGADDLVCVAGSLYLVGRARRFFFPEEDA